MSFIEKVQIEERSLCSSIVVANSPAAGDTTTYFNYSSQYVTSGDYNESANESAIMRLIEFANGEIQMNFADAARFQYTRKFIDCLTFTY